MPPEINFYFKIANMLNSSFVCVCVCVCVGGGGGGVGGGGLFHLMYRTSQERIDEISTIGLR